ncbi:hypothetical protein [Lysinibacillus sp. C5.1]|uniref:hypothetical protein n=1 Tax=Lysinibacillus sp. C5.1 TaxID=2796169 RepID=UPI003081E82F
MGEQEESLKQGILTINKPERPHAMTDEQYDRWVKDCELRAWFNSFADDQREYRNRHMNMRIMTVFNQKIGPLTKEEELLYKTTSDASDCTKSYQK